MWNGGNGSVQSGLTWAKALTAEPRERISRRATILKYCRMFGVLTHFPNIECTCGGIVQHRVLCGKNQRLERNEEQVPPQSQSAPSKGACALLRISLRRPWPFVPPPAASWLDCCQC